MADERNDSPLSGGYDEDTMIVYINPEVLQSLADVSARKEQSFRALLDAAEEGDLDAQYKVAMSYCNGTDGAPKDGEQAFRWFTRAAEGDHISAQYGLGLCWLRGIGTEKDPERGAQQLSQVAEQGYPPAQCELGLCYELGAGVEMDKLRAAELYREAGSRTTPPPSAIWAFSTTGASGWKRTMRRR